MKPSAQTSSTTRGGMKQMSKAGYETAPDFIPPESNLCHITTGKSESEDTQWVVCLKGLYLDHFILFYT